MLDTRRQDVAARVQAQLDLALGAAEVTLEDEVLEALDDTHKAHPMPY